MKSRVKKIKLLIEKIFNSQFEGSVFIIGLILLLAVLKIPVWGFAHASVLFFTLVFVWWLLGVFFDFLYKIVSLFSRKD
jgi:hypothetical protein